MQITNTIASLYQMGATRPTGSTTTVSNGTTVGSAEQSNSGSVKTYDFTNMTRSQMRDVANGLLQSGQISFDDDANLTMIGPLGKAGPNGEFIPFTEAERAAEDNKPMNYIGIINDHIASLQNSGAASDPMSGYQSWVRLSSALQSRQGSVSGVDLRA